MEDNALEYYFAQVRNAPPEIVEQVAFLARAEVLSLTEGYLYSTKEFDCQNLQYYFSGSYPNIKVAAKSDPTKGFLNLEEEQATRRRRNPLELLDREYLIHSFGEPNNRRVRLFTIFDQFEYALSSEELETICGWLEELGWAEAVPIPPSESDITRTHSLSLGETPFSFADLAERANLTADLMNFITDSRRQSTEEHTLVWSSRRDLTEVILRMQRVLRDAI